MKDPVPDSEYDKRLENIRTTVERTFFLTKNKFEMFPEYCGNVNDFTMLFKFDLAIINERKILSRENRRYYIPAHIWSQINEEIED